MTQLPDLGAVEACLADGALEVVFQAIVDTSDGVVVGLEALSRFADRRPPDLWFGAAAAVGLGVELELLAVERALDAVRGAPPGVYVAVNASPATVLSGRLAGALLASSVPVVLELTEQTAVDDYAALTAAVWPLRAAGVRLAADDTGAGYSGLTHLLALDPDVIKLDRGLIRRIDADPAKRSLVSAVADFAGQIGAAVVAEGVETEDELRTVTGVGIRLVQGYHLARPAPLPEVLPTFPALRARKALIVDDDPIVRSVLRAALEKGGFRVVGEATDGVEGLAVARSTMPDVVLLDVHMPMMTGTEALPVLRKVVPDAAIFLLTAALPDEGTSRLADGFLDKHVAVMDLAALLDGSLRNRAPAPDPAARLGRAAD